VVYRPVPDAARLKSTSSPTTLEDEDDDEYENEAAGFAAKNRLDQVSKPD
jgi:hypothetical protein